MKSECLQHAHNVNFCRMSSLQLVGIYVLDDDFNGVHGVAVRAQRRKVSRQDDEANP